MAIPQPENASICEARAVSAPGLSPLLLAAGVGIVLVMAATAALWAYYGTAVFYEMIAAGLAACL